VERRGGILAFVNGANGATRAPGAKRPRLGKDMMMSKSTIRDLD